MLQTCQPKVSNKSVSQEFFKVLRESVVPEYATRVSRTRLSKKSVKQECSARVAFNAIEHLLFVLYYSVGTLLRRDFLEHAFGYVALAGFFTFVII